MGDHCQEALDRLFLFIDQELPDDELREIAAHLNGCPPCETEKRVNERIKAIVSGCPHEQAPEELRMRVLQIVGEVRAAGGDSAVGGDAAPVS
jgi:mycothiol system anti-sigma-R factor